MPFELLQIVLPHEGVQPGGGKGGVKKQVIPVGTKIWCITRGTKFYWIGYLDQDQAWQVLTELYRTTFLLRPPKRIPLPTMLAWNFKDVPPTRIARVKHKETLR